MRPVPESRHVWAALILAAVAAVSVILAVADSQLSSSQMDIMSAALKRHQAELFQHDPVYGQSELWRFHTPIFQVMMELVLVPTRYRDLTLPFKAMVGLTVIVYLAGMYALLYRQTRSWSISAFTAVLSLMVVQALGNNFWGIGSLESITPANLVLAMTPLIVLAMLTYEERWQLLLVFGAVGLTGNLHLVTAMNLTIVLLIVYLGRHRFSAASWRMAAGCALFALIGAFPYAFYFITLRLELTPAGAGTSREAIQQAMNLAGLEVVYPALLRPMLGWLPVLAALMIPALAVLTRMERFRTRNLNVWVWFMIAAGTLSLVMPGASQLVGAAAGKGPPVIDFIQASSLVMLPLYVLLGQTLVNLFRILRGSHQILLRIGCGVLLAIWAVPSDNFRVVRHAVYDLTTSFMPEADKPRRIQEIHARAEQKAELNRLAEWARSNTDAGAVFIVDDQDFRRLSRRSIFSSREDVKYFYYLQPWNLDKWGRSVADQKRLLHPPAGTRIDAMALAMFAADMAARDEYIGAGEWYVVLDAEAAPENAGQVREIVGKDWGKRYRLFKVR